MPSKQCKSNMFSKFVFAVCILAVMEEVYAPYAPQAHPLEGLEYLQQFANPTQYYTPPVARTTSNPPNYASYPNQAGSQVPNPMMKYLHVVPQKPSQVMKIDPRVHNVQLNPGRWYNSQDPDVAKWNPEYFCYMGDCYDNSIERPPCPNLKKQSVAHIKANAYYNYKRQYVYCPDEMSAACCKSLNHNF